MQTTGYINLRGHGKILILARQDKYSCYFKRRKTGKDGHHFIDEELYLNRQSDESGWNFVNTEKRKALLNNEVIYL